MKQYLLAIAIAIVAVAGVSAQKTVTSDSTAAAASSTSVGNSLSSSTQISGQLQNSLDVNKAKVGDQVVVKTTKAVKQNGQTVIAKGSQLIGRVTEVKRKTKENATSTLGVVFDRLRSGKDEIPVTATIMSVFNAQASTPIADTEMDGYATASSTRTTGGSNGGSGGGLLGGVGSIVGGVVNSTTSTVDGVGNAATSIVGGTANSVTGGIKGLSISNSTSASASGGTSLTQSGKNLKIDKGATFNMNVSSSTSVSKQ